MVKNMTINILLNQKTRKCYSMTEDMSEDTAFLCKSVKCNI